MKKLLLFVIVSFTLVSCSVPTTPIHRPDKLFKVCSENWGRSYEKTFTCGYLKHSDVRRMFGDKYFR